MELSPIYQISYAYIQPLCFAVSGCEMPKKSGLTSELKFFVTADQASFSATQWLEIIKQMKLCVSSNCSIKQLPHHRTMGSLDETPFGLHPC